MKLSNEDRKILFDKFLGLEFKVSNLKGIVQNEMNITKNIMIEHSKDMELVIGEFSNLSNEVYVKLLECIEK